MDAQIPPTLETPGENTLLTSEEYKEFLREAQRLERYAGNLSIGVLYSFFTAASVGALATVWLVSEVPILSTVFLILVLGKANQLVERYEGAYLKRQSSLVERMVTAISEARTADMLGPLLDLYSVSNSFDTTYPEIRSAVNAAILRLLPLITADHAELFTTQRRERLRQYRYRAEPGYHRYDLEKSPYIRGLIHAFEQIGDKRDLYHIQEWLEAVNRQEKSPVTLPMTDFEREQHRKLAASIQHCLDVVTERAAREEGKDFLLRPDRKPETGEALLRPATDAADKSPEQLLRPSSDDSAPPF